MDLQVLFSFSFQTVHAEYVFPRRGIVGLSTSKFGIYTVNLLSEKDSAFSFKPHLDCNFDG